MVQNVLCEMTKRFTAKNKKKKEKLSEGSIKFLSIGLKRFLSDLLKRFIIERSKNFLNEGSKNVS